MQQVPGQYSVGTVSNMSNLILGAAALRSRPLLSSIWKCSSRLSHPAPRASRRLVEFFEPSAILVCQKKEASVLQHCKAKCSLQTSIILGCSLAGQT